MFCRAIIAESGFAEEIIKIEHVALYVNNLVEARNFSLSTSVDMLTMVITIAILDFAPTS